MANTMPPTPYKTPMLDKNGFLSTAWTAWFIELFKRIGGNVASTITELDSGSSTIQVTVSTHTTQIATLQANIDELNQGPNL